MSKSFQKSLEECRILIYGIDSNQSIKTKIAAIYTPERLQVGVQLYQICKAASENQSIEKIESTQAGRNYRKTYDKIYERLLKIRKAGRYFFKNDAELSTLLRLNKDIPSNYADWKSLCDETTNAIAQHEAIQGKLTLVELGPEEITEMALELAKIDQLKIKAEKEDGEAQVATVQKNESHQELMTYCSDLRACLDLFYEGSERQILEQVGILVR